MSLSSSRNIGWLSLALLIAFFVAVVMLAPAEKTLGETIRYVYAHVAFTRAGMAGFYIAGLMGLFVTLTGNKKLQSWTQTICGVAFALFVFGGFFSIFAQRASWGGIPLAEPRIRTSMSAVAVAIIVLLLNSWLPWIRVRGLLYMALAVYVAWVIPRTPLVLHPPDAGGNSASPWIRLTFPLLTALALLMGTWIVWYLERVKAKAL